MDKEFSQRVVATSGGLNQTVRLAFAARSLVPNRIYRKLNMTWHQIRIILCMYTILTVKGGMVMDISIPQSFNLFLSITETMSSECTPPDDPFERVKSSWYLYAYPHTRVVKPEEKY